MTTSSARLLALKSSANLLSSATTSRVICSRHRSSSGSALAFVLFLAIAALVSGSPAAAQSTTGATWAANYVYKAATAFVHTSAERVTPTVFFTGAPADATNGSNFVVTASSNETGADASTPSITAGPSTVCTVGSVSRNGPGSYQATVTTVKATGLCTTKAVWVVNPDYKAVTAVQHTTAQ